MRKRGFTFIEMILAIGLFSVAIPIVLGTFVSASRAQRETTALLMANSSIGFALEQMAREMRTGKEFTCTSCTGGSDVSFTNAKGDAVTYRFVPGGASTPGRFTRQVGAVSEEITSPSVNIASAQFIVQGYPLYATGDLYPTRITITARANPRIKSTNLVNTLDFQTSVSARFDY